MAIFSRMRMLTRVEKHYSINCQFRFESYCAQQFEVIALIRKVPRGTFKITVKSILLMNFHDSCLE